MSALLKTTGPNPSSGYSSSSTPYTHNNNHSTASSGYTPSYVPAATKQYTAANYDYVPVSHSTADTSAAAYLAAAEAAAAAFPNPIVVRSPSVKPMAALSRHVPEPTATPRSSGQRCLPETPRTNVSGAATTAAAAATTTPIYANLEAGNSRNASQVSRLLEEGARLRENGGNPPAIPRPAARLSLRQKVIRPPPMALMKNLPLLQSPPPIRFFLCVFLSVRNITMKHSRSPGYYLAPDLQPLNRHRFAGALPPHHPNQTPREEPPRPLSIPPFPKKGINIHPPPLPLPTLSSV